MSEWVDELIDILEAERLQAGRLFDLLNNIENMSPEPLCALKRTFSALCERSDYSERGVQIVETALLDRATHLWRNTQPYTAREVQDRLFAAFGVEALKKNTSKFRAQESR